MIALASFFTCILITTPLLCMEKEKAAERLDKQKFIASLHRALLDRRYDDYFAQVEALVDMRARFLVYDLSLDDKSRTALHIMIRNKAEPRHIAKLVLEGADIFAVLHGGYTAIHSMASYGDKARLDCLFACRSRAEEVKMLSVRSDLHELPLHCAARFGNCEALEYLINLGAVVDAEMSGRTTAMYEAAYNDHVEAIACLYKYGADHFKGKIYVFYNALSGTEFQEAVSPLDAARKRGNIRAQICLEILDELEKVKKSKDFNAPNVCKIPILPGVLSSILSLANIQCGTLLMKACYEGFYYLSDIILEDHRTLVNVKGPNGNTALHYAAEKGHHRCVALLLRKKRDVVEINTKNDDGETALHNASRKGYVEVIRILLTYPGIDPMLKNKAGLTAWELVPDDNCALVKELFGVSQAGSIN